MKAYEYKPGTIKSLEGEEVQSPFKGSVEIQVPTYKERLEILKGLDIKKDEIDISQGHKMIALVEKHVSKVDLKAGKESYKSVEDLGYCREGTELINHIGSIVVSGIPLGNG